MRECFWVEGKIAVFNGDRYLIERVQSRSANHVVVDFRSLRSWHLCDDDTRRISGEDEGCDEVRDPTDLELAFIAACRLVSDGERVDLEGIVKC